MRSIRWLPLLLCLLPGCIFLTVDDDDDAGDDDDDTAFFGEEGELGCAEADNPRDLWLAVVPADAELRVTVDTVAADSAFDPAVFIIDSLDLEDGQVLGEGDDELDCSFAPLEHGCPRADASVEAGDIGVLVVSYGNCTGSVGAYRIEAELDGVPIPLTLFEDEVPVAARDAAAPEGVRTFK